MNSLKTNYMRFWKSVAKRTARFRLYRHYFHNRMLLDMSEPTSREIWAGFEYEYAEYEHVTASLREEPADIFFDIGANWGGYSLVAARAGAKRIEAFEPNRKVFGLLAANVTLNDFHNEIRAWNIAAGGEDKDGFLSTDPRATDVSSLSPERMPDKWDYSGSQTCRIRRMDTFMPVSDASLFIKIDVEGHELEVLKGLRQIIASNRVRMLVEVFNAQEFTEIALNDYGLKLKKNFGSNLYLTNF